MSARPFGPAIIPSYGVEAQDWLDALPTSYGGSPNPRPDIALRLGLSDAIREMKNSGVWQNTPVLFLGAVNTLANSLLNVKDPTKSFTPYGSLAVVPYSMVKGDGSTGWIDTGYTFAIPEPAWTPSTAFAHNAECYANGNVYRASVAGTTAATGRGPSGTGSAIVDGTVTWAFQMAYNGYLSAFGVGQNDLSFFVQSQYGVSERALAIGSIGGSYAAGLRILSGAACILYPGTDGNFSIGGQANGIGFKGFSSIGPQPDGSYGTFINELNTQPYIGASDGMPSNRIGIFRASVYSGNFSSSGQALSGVSTGLTTAQLISANKAAQLITGAVGTYLQPNGPITLLGQSFSYLAINHTNPAPPTFWIQFSVDPPQVDGSQPNYARFPATHSSCRATDLIRVPQGQSAPISETSIHAMILEWNNRVYPNLTNTPFGGLRPNDVQGGLQTVSGFSCGAIFDDVRLAIRADICQTMYTLGYAARNDTAGPAGCAIVNAGTGYALFDKITCANGAVLTVLSLSGSTIAAVCVSTSPTSTPSGSVAQSSTTGAGTGATFHFSYGYGFLDVLDDKAGAFVFNSVLAGATVDASGFDAALAANPGLAGTKTTITGSTSSGTLVTAASNVPVGAVLLGAGIAYNTYVSGAGTTSGGTTTYPLNQALVTDVTNVAITYTRNLAVNTGPNVFTRGFAEASPDSIFDADSPFGNFRVCTDAVILPAGRIPDIPTVPVWGMMMDWEANDGRSAMQFMVNRCTLEIVAHAKSLKIGYQIDPFQGDGQYLWDLTSEGAEYVGADWVAGADLILRTFNGQSGNGDPTQLAAWLDVEMTQLASPAGYIDYSKIGLNMAIGTLVPVTYAQAAAANAYIRSNGLAGGQIGPANQPMGGNNPNSVGNQATAGFTGAPTGT